MDEDIDGVPMDEDDSSNVQSKEDDKKPSIPAGFVPSRWETVDPDQVKIIILQEKITIFKVELDSSYSY